MINPDRNQVVNERHKLQKEIKRLNMLVDEIRIAVRGRYGSKGQDWYTRLQVQLRRKR